MAIRTIDTQLENIQTHTHQTNKQMRFSKAQNILKKCAKGNSRWISCQIVWHICPYSTNFMNRRENTNKIPNKETLIIFTGYRTLNKKWIFNAYENFFLNISD